MSNQNRRDVLALIGAGAVSISGCLDEEGDQSNRGTPTNTELTATPEGDSSPTPKDDSSSNDSAEEREYNADDVDDVRFDSLRLSNCVETIVPHGVCSEAPEARRASRSTVQLFGFLYVADAQTGEIDRENLDEVNIRGGTAEEQYESPVAFLDDVDFETEYLVVLQAESTNVLMDFDSETVGEISDDEGYIHLDISTGAGESHHHETLLVQAEASTTPDSVTVEYTHTDEREEDPNVGRFTLETE